MDFKQWLAEMPLASFNYDFKRPRMGVQEPSSVKQASNHDRFTDYDAYGMPVGQDDVNGYYSQKDRFTISHPKTMQTLEKVLSRHEYRFNILLIEKGGHDIEGVWYPGDLTMFITKIRDYMQQNNIPKEGHITFAKNGSTGHVLTPWMILHTIGHALFNRKANFKWNDEMMGMLADKWRFMKQNFMFRSANARDKKNDVATAEEMIYELVAEYLWNGKIRINPNTDEASVEKINKLQAIIQDRLNQAVGTIVYDFYA